MVNVFVSVGSNIDRILSISSALEALAREFGKLTKSPVYECPAVGFEGEPFFNLVVKFSTKLSPVIVAQRLNEIELECGRLRTDRRMASRRIDLDMLLYGDLVEPDDHVRVPREDILVYAFVLKPLADIAPDLHHPVNNMTMKALWEAFDRHALPLRHVAEQELSELPSRDH